MRRTIAVALVLTLLAFVAGCGSKSSSSSNSSAASQPTSTTNKTHLAKTKFVLHAGLAFGAFHRYIYKPFKRGAFSGGLAHHKAAVAKAALAAAFAYHETRLALNAARSSKVLSTALKPLLALQTSLSNLRNGFHRGNVNAATIQSANGDTSTVSKVSASKGQPIQDQPTPQLGG
ncbi:MAG: hypothetical protein JOZ73_00105 [Solirubrobacterales bacterium]|nr:hypothetical protein [Solirubrobacterales bacterium]